MREVMRSSSTEVRTRGPRRRRRLRFRSLSPRRKLSLRKSGDGSPRTRKRLKKLSKGKQSKKIQINCQMPPNLRKRKVQNPKKAMPHTPKTSSHSRAKKP